METAALVAPVTALEFIQNKFLVSGEGPVLTVYSLHPCPKSCSSLSVLQHQRIHGIRPRESDLGNAKTSELEQCGSTPSFYDLAVFGGKAIRLIRFNIMDPLRLENIGSVMELHDWILDVRWVCGDPRSLLCIALAHNSALLLDTETESTLYQRSCAEGCLLYSALVLAHKSWSDTVLIGGTVFNQLVIWKPGHVAESVELKAPVERRLLGHSGVIFDISYLQKEGVLASASDDRSVRIWQVGNLGGNGGHCGDLNPVCLHVLYGHQARVFSVRLLNSNVFSAGEDGACLMWDNGHVVQTLKGHRAGGVRALAICSENCEKGMWLASGGADGAVRLWTLGVKQDQEEDNEENLKDLNFPMDKVDINEVKKTKVKQKDKSLRSEKVNNPYQADNSKLEKGEFAIQMEDSETKNVANKMAVATLEHIKSCETYGMQEVCQGAHLETKQVNPKVVAEATYGRDSRDEMEAKPTVEKTVGIGVPKVICTLDYENSPWSACRFIVCTDKGGVYEYSNEKWKLVWQGPHEFQSYCVMEVVSVRIKDSLVHLCAVGNIIGSVQLFPVANPESGTRLVAGNGKIHSLIWQKGNVDGGAWLLASGNDGLVYRWRIELKDTEKLELKVEEIPKFELPNCAKRWLTAARRVQLGKDVGWVCGDRRGSLLLYQEYENAEMPTGQEQTALVKANSQASKKLAPTQGLTKMATHRVDQMELMHKVNQELDAEIQINREVIREANAQIQDTSKVKRMLKLTPVSALFGVHGKQGVTSIFEDSGLYYSTGRDGCVRIFCSNVSENEGNFEQHSQQYVLDVLRIQRACKGMEWLEKILILETKIGQEVENLSEENKESTEINCQHVKSVKNVQEVRFAIVGFHGNHFVVWDPVRQERLLSVLCGGGHRSWSLWTDDKGHWTGNGALVFIKQGSVLASERFLKEANGKIGWTLREGIHGKGIGCVHRLGRILSRRNACWELVVTGGEDTSVTVLALNPQNGEMKVLAVLTDHISSVRALTAVVKQDGDRTALSALVVSAGGRAQMQCYRLLIGCDERGDTPSCQVIQVAAHRLDEQWERKRNRHKMVKMDPETRYMSITVLERTPESLIVALACSDGAVRLFSVSEVSRHIELLWESFHHQRCVLSVATCCLRDTQGNRHTLLFSAATDGQIATWDFTSFSPSNQNPSSPIITVPVHQSGVNSLDIYSIRLNDIYHITVASGGDDGQLTVSQIKIQFIDNSDLENQLSVNLIKQAHIPLAHASPLTSLKLLNKNQIVSTSCDQRVCLWRIDSAEIRHQRAVCSHVADAAALAVWEDKCDKKSGSSAEFVFGGGQESGNKKAGAVRTEKSDTGETKNGYVLICGQGLQLFQIL